MGVGKIVKDYLLAGLITLEYWVRSKSFDRARNLKNKCSTCHLKGHNAQNCPNNRKWLRFAEGMCGEAADEVADECEKHIHDQIAAAGLFSG